MISDNSNTLARITVSRSGMYYFINVDENIGKAWNRITICQTDSENFAKAKAKNIAQQIGCMYEELIK